MIKRIITIVFILPVAIVLIALIVANRTLVPATIDPFNPGNPALTWEAPLFVWVMGALAIGVMLGGLGTWLTQAHHRRAERLYKREATGLRAETEELKKKVATPAGPGLPVVRA